MPNITIGAETLFHIFGFSITNTLVMSWIVMIVLIVIAQLVSRKVRLIPAPFQNIVESAVESLLGFMENILGSREKAEKYFPFIATIFIFVLISNWLGIIPGVGSVGFYHIEEGKKVFEPLLRSTASDLNFTLALAFISVIMVNIYGIRAQGVWSHIGRYISFKNPISFFVGILEIIGEFAKMVSFSFRLFGNVFAGEVLLIITGFLAPYIVPIPFLGMELFVGFIQALVFATLTLVFISIAIANHGGHEAPEHA